MTNLLLVTRITDTGGDWEALYIGDELIDQNHSLDWWSLLPQLPSGAQFSSYEVNMESLGECPPTLTEYHEMTVAIA